MKRNPIILEEPSLDFQSERRSYSGLPLIAVEPPRSEIFHELGVQIGHGVALDLEMGGPSSETVNFDVVSGWYAVDLVLAGNASNTIPKGCGCEVCSLPSRER